MPDEEKNQDDLFDEMSEVLSPREDAIPQSDDELVAGGSLRQQMQFSPKKSDAQIADERLFPLIQYKDVIIDWLTQLQVARIFPDVYVPYRNMIAKDLMFEYDDITLTKAYVIAETVLSIAIDGEGRIDALAIFGRLGEKKEEEKAGI